MKNKKDSKFWREYKRNLPSSLESNLRKWKKRLPIKEDFDGEYNLFNSENFSIIIKGLKLIDVKIY